MLNLNKPTDIGRNLLGQRRGHSVFIVNHNAYVFTKPLLPWRIRLFVCKIRTRCVLG